MKNQIGNAVFGDSFYGRSNEIKEARYFLDRGNSIALFGLRRIGKSSLLRELTRIYNENKKYHVIDIDVQDAEDLIRFFQQIFNKLPRNVKSKFADSIKELPILIQDWLNVSKLKIGNVAAEFQPERPDDKILRNYWGDISDAFTKILTKDEKILLVIDELPFFLDNLKDDAKTEDSRRVLTTLRSWREKGISMALAGSIQIDHFLEDIGLSQKLLSGLNRIPVLPFRREEAIGLMNTLLESENVQVKKELQEKAIDLLLDYVPIFIQIFAKEVIVNEPENQEDIEKLYETKVLSKIEKEFLDQFDERFATLEKMENGERTAEAIFDTLEQHSEVSNSSLRKEIENYNEKVRLKLLMDDFLIASSHGKIAFSLNYVKYWWRQRKS